MSQHELGHDNVPQLSLRDHERFNKLLLERCGMHFSENRQVELALGVREAFAASPCSDLDEYYALLRDPASGRVEMNRLINAVTVGETHFFRNRPQFDALYHYVLPEIIERKRTTRTIRIWSAGCASGEEPYSVAILLRQLLPDTERWTVTILGTDINQDALRRARRALYGDWAFREEHARRWRTRYFVPENKSHRLVPEIGRMVRFSRLNLVKDRYPGPETHTEPLDLILCRNVTIYFSELVTRKVVNRFYEALADGGWLVVGHAEPSLSIYRHFEAHNYPDAILYRRGLSLTDIEQTPLEMPQNTETTTSEKVRANVDNPLDLYKQAHQKLELGFAEEARDLLLPLLQTQPENTNGCALLGRTYANLGQWREAEIWCARAVQLNPLSTEAYYTLSLIYQQQQRLDEAIDAMKKVVYLDRSHVLGHFGLANLYGDKRQWEQAQKSLTNACRLIETLPDNEIVPGSGGVTVNSLRQTIIRRQQRWLIEEHKALKLEMRSIPGERSH